jgi:DnaJ-class molecular chaperone
MKFSDPKKKAKYDQYGHQALMVLEVSAEAEVMPE